MATCIENVLFISPWILLLFSCNLAPNLFLVPMVTTVTLLEDGSQAFGVHLCKSGKFLYYITSTSIS